MTVDKDFFEDVKKDLNEIKPEDVQAFIILVKGKDTDDPKKSEGLNALQGDGKELINLISNIDPDLIRKFMALKMLGEINNDS